MKLKKVDVLVTKVELKKNGKGEAYLLVDLVDMGSGDSFNIMSKDIELMSKIKQMTKYKIDLTLTNSKFGLRLEISNLLEEIGGI